MGGIFLDYVTLPFLGKIISQLMSVAASYYSLGKSKKAVSSTGTRCLLDSWGVIIVSAQ